MTQRLIIFVLLFAYGLPAVVGHGLHWLLPAEAEAGCHACSCGHRHDPVKVVLARRGSGQKQKSVEVQRGRSPHDCQTCVVCKQQRLAQSTSGPRWAPEVTPLVFRWLPSVSLIECLETERLSQPRAPPC